LAKSQWSFKSATELSAALAAKKVSAVELAQDAIGRIERHDGKINAICVRDFARGLEAARAADAARARGETGALLGIPLTVKESYNVAGLPTTWGFPPQKDFVASEDALSISRVKQAGGVILGKTNVPVGLADWQSYNEIYGTTNNPFDLGRTPGAPPADRRRRWRRVTGRCRWAPISAVRCACRRSTAASMRTSRPTTSCRRAAIPRRRSRRYRWTAIWR
jgi:amidase